MDGALEYACPHATQLVDRIADTDRLFTDRELGTILDALNVRALDVNVDRFGDGGGDDAADLFLKLTGLDPHEGRSAEERLP